MRKIVTILVSSLLLLPLNACAQWYLFPGNGKAQTEKKTETVKTEKAESKTSSDTTSVKSALEKIFGDGQSSENGGKYEMEKVSKVKVTLALPLKASSSKPSDNFYEMYCGALLAARELGTTGIPIELKVSDIGDSKVRLSAMDIAESDVVIGPVSIEDIKAALPLCGEGHMLVSPLEPSAAALADTANVIQTPVPYTCQLDELVDWLREDTQYGDQVIVLKDTTAAGSGEYSAYLLDRLSKKGVRYKSCLSLASAGIDKDHTYRIVVASDSQNYITSTLRSVAVTASRLANDRVMLYCTSKVRNSIGGNATDLHNSNARLVASYTTDYDDQATKNFILAYRALYNAEPTQFAYQGYDVMKYCTKMCWEYGRQWYKVLPEHPESGLQSNFVFDKERWHGKVNTAVRRTIYRSNLTSEVVK